MAGKRGERDAGRGGAQLEEAVAAGVIVVTDADYRSLALPCDALEEGEGPARPVSTPGCGKGVSRAAGR